MAPGRNLLLPAHPLKEQPAQLSYCCSWSPLANCCLAGARTEPGRKGDSCQHRSSPATSGCRGTLSSPAQTFWRGRGWSPHTCTVQISVKAARRGPHNHLPLLCKCPHRPHFGHEAEEGQMSALAPGGRRYPFPSNAAHTKCGARRSRTADTSPCLSISSSCINLLTTPRKAMSGVCFLGKSVPSIDLPGRRGLWMRLQRGGLSVEGLLHAVNAEII